MCMFHTSIKYILLHTLHVCVGTRMFGCLALVNGNDFTGVTFTSLQYFSESCFGNDNKFLLPNPRVVLFFIYPTFYLLKI